MNENEIEHGHESIPLMHDSVELPQIGHVSIKTMCRSAILRQEEPAKETNSPTLKLEWARAIVNRSRGKIAYLGYEGGVSIL